LALALFRRVDGQGRRQQLLLPGVRRLDRARESRVALGEYLDTHCAVWDTGLVRPRLVAGGVGEGFGCSSFVEGKRIQDLQE